MIHQIFWPFNDKELKDIPVFQQNVDETKLFCKAHNYEYKLWDLKDCEKLIEEEFSEYSQLWKDFRFDIQRCDFIRYCILYKFGGLYLDCDIRPMKNIDAVFSSLATEEPIYFVHWDDDKNKKPYNAVMGSKKNHKLFLEIIKQVKNDFYEKSSLEIYDKWKGRFVYQTTGHSMLERVIKKNKIDKNKCFHNVLFVENNKKTYLGGQKFVGDCNTALFYDGNASVWFDNLI